MRTLFVDHDRGQPRDDLPRRPSCGKVPRPPRADTAALRREFAAYLEAVRERRYSAAVGPRRRLAEAGIEILYRPRPEGGAR